ncbi:MAG: hypothetical protein RIQ33_2060 [Bacteroidota bacterium]|jgi:purine-cytosine permease-like protein
MKKFAIAISLSVVALTIVFSSCSSNKKTLGCPGMITKSATSTTEIKS